jgi:hypothetical protein
MDGAGTAELVQKLLSERASTGIEARALHFSGYFPALHRRAARLRVGRNAAERLPAIWKVIETTDLLTRSMTMPSLAPFRRAFVTSLSVLGLEYGRSPIIDGGGKRCFDDSMRGGKGIGRRFLLLGNRDADAGTREALRQFAESLCDVVELRFVTRDDTVLVRPDGYIACTLRADDVASGCARVRALLDRQIRRHTAHEIEPVLDPGPRPRRAGRQPARSAWS